VVSLTGMMLLNPNEWARRQFGRVQLEDKRRTPRAVSMAAAFMRNPSASLPRQMGSPKALKAAYRLLAQEDITFAALLEPHWQQTRTAARPHPVVLLVQDTTELDYSPHYTTMGLGPIGNGRGRGLLLQTVLAVVPQPRQVLGLAHQEPFLRQPVPRPGENASQRQKRPRESQVWSRSVAAIGPAPACSRWVHVGDRYSDIYDFQLTCQQTQTDFLVRARHNRRIYTPQGRSALLFRWLRRLAPQGERTLDVPAQHGLAARAARVRISFEAVTLRPPIYLAQRSPLPVWVIRIWEPEPPADTEPLEWILVTSVPTENVEAAWERAAWYTCRWLVEEYHHCLKTGCEIEKRQLQDGAGLKRLLGFLSPVAVRLLQLRELARLNPEQLAASALPRELVHLVAYLADVPAERLTLGSFWRAVAQQGGYLGRRRDGPPGWKTLWRGWLHIQTLLEGMRLASALSP
jgi:hypothetical protein